MDSIKISWNKNNLSLNKWYASSHWKQRDRDAKEWHHFFTVLILEAKAKIPKDINTYELSLSYNSRIDPTNAITMIKLFEDVLIKKRLIIDDSGKYCKRIEIKFDNSLPRNRFEITLQPLSTGRPEGK